MGSVCPAGPLSGQLSWLPTLADGPGPRGGSAGSATARKHSRSRAEREQSPVPLPAPLRADGVKWSSFPGVEERSDIDSWGERGASSGDRGSPSRHACPSCLNAPPCTRAPRPSYPTPRGKLRALPRHFSHAIEDHDRGAGTRRPTSPHPAREAPKARRTPNGRACGRRGRRRIPPLTVPEPMLYSQTVLKRKLRRRAGFGARDRYAPPGHESLWVHRLALLDPA